MTDSMNDISQKNARRTPSSLSRNGTYLRQVFLHQSHPLFSENRAFLPPELPRPRKKCRSHAHHLLNIALSFRSISRRVSLHSLGYLLPARNAAPTRRLPPAGSMIFSIDSGKAKWVPCSYNNALNLQLCGLLLRRSSMRRIYLHVSHRTSSSAPMHRTFPCIFSIFIFSSS